MVVVTVVVVMVVVVIVVVVIVVIVMVLVVIVAVVMVVIVKIMMMMVVVKIEVIVMVNDNSKKDDDITKNDTANAARWRNHGVVREWRIPAEGWPGGWNGREGPCGRHSTPGCLAAPPPPAQPASPWLTRRCGPGSEHPATTHPTTA